MSRDPFPDFKFEDATGEPEASDIDCGLSSGDRRYKGGSREDVYRRFNADLHSKSGLSDFPDFDTWLSLQDNHEGSEALNRGISIFVYLVFALLGVLTASIVILGIVAVWGEIIS